MSEMRDLKDKGAVLDVGYSDKAKRGAAVLATSDAMTDDLTSAKFTLA
jgi:hypothetical protein